jgi:hypothetical protein
MDFIETFGGRRGAPSAVTGETGERAEPFLSEGYSATEASRLHLTDGLALLFG